MSKSQVAPPQSAPAKRKASRTGSKVSGHAAANSGKNRRPVTGSKSLKAKEAEYRKLNAELEAKTAELVKEAEHLVKGNLSLLCDLESSAEMTTSPSQHHTHITRSPTPPPSLQSQSHSHTSHTHQHKKATTRLPAAQVVMATDSVSAAVDKVALKAEQELDLPEWNEDFKQGTRHEATHAHIGNDILPETADDMGPEALTRFLKAKLRVMQEEIDHLCQELTAKEKQLSVKESKVKELSDLNTKLQRTHHAMQPELEKYKKLSESLQLKCGGLESQLTALRKEVEVMKGGEKKARTQQGAVEVRLNRAMEEMDKYKTELTTLRAHSQDASKSERVKVERLTVENKQLLKQRNELMTAFKKQLKLIDILKRQKMHIEAAKMLSFTEEEFMKALDWQAT